MGVTLGSLHIYFLKFKPNKLEFIFHFKNGSTLKSWYWWSISGSILVKAIWLIICKYVTSRYLVWSWNTLWALKSDVIKCSTLVDAKHSNKILFSFSWELGFDKPPMLIKPEEQKERSLSPESILLTRNFCPLSFERAKHVHLCSGSLLRAAYDSKFLKTSSHFTFFFSQILMRIMLVISMGHVNLLNRISTSCSSNPFK